MVSRSFFRETRLKSVPFNIRLDAVLCALAVLIEPFFNGLFLPVRAPARDTPTTKMIHAPHKDRPQNLDDHVVDILVRPEGGLVDNPGFPGGGVVPLKGPVGFRVEIPGDLAKLLRPFLLCPLHPLIGLVVFAILVYLPDRLEFLRPGAG